jgi:hypothetical protein
MENKIALFFSQSLLRVTNTQALLAASHDAPRCSSHLAPCGTAEFWALRSCGVDLTQAQLQRKGKNENSVILMETWLQTESEGNGIPGGSKREVLITLQQEAGRATNLSTVQVMASLSPKLKRKFTLYVFVHIHYQRGTR